MSLIPKFSYQYIPNAEKTEAMGYTQYDQVEWVEIQTDKNNITSKAVDARVKEQFPDEYRAWKGNAPVQVEGFPLRNLPLLSQVQVLQAAERNIHSLEEFVEAPRDVVQMIDRGIEAQEEAKAWIKLAKDKAGPAKKLAAMEQALQERDARIAVLERQLAAMPQARVPDPVPDTSTDHLISVPSQ